MTQISKRKVFFFTFPSRDNRINHQCASDSPLGENNHLKFAADINFYRFLYSRATVDISLILDWFSREIECVLLFSRDVDLKNC